MTEHPIFEALRAAESAQQRINEIAMSLVLYWESADEDEIQDMIDWLGQAISDMNKALDIK